MDNAIYALASKQIATFRDLEVIANNVANVNTGGYRADKAVFSSFMYNDIHDKAALPAAHYTVSDFQEGSMQPTGRSLDIAINGAGFFMVLTPLGPRYTRNGGFRILDGKLATSDGYSVSSVDGQEIVFDESDVNPIITEDGKVMVGPEERGQIGVFEFANPKLMRKVGNSLFSALEEAIPSTNSKIAQGMIEGSNVNAVMQIARLSELEKEISQTTNLIHETYNMERSAFKLYAKVGG